MRLPFTHDQFLEVFADYNRSVGAFGALLWVLTVAALIALARAGPRASRWTALVLCIHWAWSALGYHLAFFRRINPAATSCAVFVLAPALRVLWFGVLRKRLPFSFSRSARGIAGAVLVVYALVYPGLGIAFGLTYPRMPTFGVPCPTVILTAGLLLLVPSRDARPPAILPFLWTAIGGSAAFLLGIRADLALPVAGAALLLHALVPLAGPRPLTTG